MTTVPKILKELEKLGTAQNRKTYGRHGVTGEMFGVSYANLKILEKRLKKEGSACLASELWAAGNHDGCVGKRASGRHHTPSYGAGTSGDPGT